MLINMPPRSLFQKIKSNFKKRKKLLLILIPIVIVGFIFFSQRKPKTIETQKVKRANLIQTVDVTGSVTAKNYANLTFPIGGTLSYLGVKKGDSVTKYQTIATLDSRSVLKNLQSALLSYSDQRNTFDQTSQNYKDTALTDSLRRILDTNQNDLNKAVVSVELQDLARQQAILTTPIDGIVTRADAQTTGVTALAGSTTFTVVDPTTVAFTMDVDEADIGRIEEGQNVEIVFDAYPSETIKTKVTKIDFVSHSTSNGGNAFGVETALGTDKNFKYKIGMNGNAQIVTAKKNGVLIVPLASVFEDDKVWVKTKKSVPGDKQGFEKRKVTLGLQNDIEAEVTAGIKEGEEIASNPSDVSK